MSTQPPPAPAAAQTVIAQAESAAGALGSRAVGIIALAAIVFSVVAFRGWLEARDDRTRMQATLASQGTLIAAAQKREEDRARQLADTLKQITDLKRTVQTPQQVIREFPQFLPTLPQPIEPIPPQQGTSAPGATPRPGGSAALPSAPGKPGEPPPQDVRVPAADLKPLFDFAQDCRACQAKLTAAQQDVNDEQAKNAALTTQRDAAVKAAKGGGMWTRTVRAAKWLTVGFAVGYVVHAAAH